MKITVETSVRAPIERVWASYTTPEDIVKWNAASADWHTTKASVDLRVGGEFSSRMEAKDGSFGFDFAGTYTRVEPRRLIEYSFGDRTAQAKCYFIRQINTDLKAPEAKARLIPLERANTALKTDGKSTCVTASLVREAAAR